MRPSLAVRRSPLAIVRVSAFGALLACAPGQVEPAAPPGVLSPPVLHGIYLSGWTFGGREFANLLRLADSTEINAFVIDVKDETGHLTYPSTVPLANAIGANAQLRAPDVADRLRLLREHHLYPIARIVVAKDPLLAAARPGWGIQDAQGALWKDVGGSFWLDGFQDSIWTYAADLAREAVAMGFAEVQFDYVRFPDDIEPGISTAIFPSRRGTETRRDGLVRHLRQLRSMVAPLKVPFTLDVFGFTASAEVPMGIGQVWEDLVTAADAIQPMIYPSHYHDTFHGIPNPNAHPYDVVRNALMDATIRARRAGGTARIRPYLQAFTQGEPPYSAAMIREQIRAAEDLGFMSWMLWNAESGYPPEAFRPKTPR